MTPLVLRAGSNSGMSKKIIFPQALVDMLFKPQCTAADNVNDNNNNGTTYNDSNNTSINKTNDRNYLVNQSVN